MKRQNALTLSGTLEDLRFVKDGAWGTLATDKPWFGGVHRVFLPRHLAMEALALHQVGKTQVDVTVVGSLFSPPLEEIIKKARSVAATRGWEAGFEWLIEHLPGAQGYVLADHIVWHVSERDHAIIKAFVEQQKAG